MTGSHLPNRAVGAKVPNFGRGEGKMVGLFTISFCSVHNDVLFFNLFIFSQNSSIVYNTNNDPK